MINDSNLIVLDIFNIVSEDLCERLKFFYENLLILEEDIYSLEKKSNFIVFPINKDLKSLKNFLKKDFKVSNFIVFTDLVGLVKPFDQISFQDLYESNKKFVFLLNYIKSFLSLFKNNDEINLFVILHKNFKNKIPFWYISDFINSSMISLMEIINFEYKNITNLRINCISTENIKNLYNKNIFPYRNIFVEKNIINLAEVCFYLSNKKINNKIIKI